MYEKKNFADSLIFDLHIAISNVEFIDLIFSEWSSLFLSRSKRIEGGVFLHFTCSNKHLQSWGINSWHRRNKTSNCWHLRLKPESPAFRRGEYVKKGKNINVSRCTPKSLPERSPPKLFRSNERLHIDRPYPKPKI